MSSAWLLPEHIADVLPAQARRVEELRRVWLDAARSHGYELVMPPLLEHIESLLSGTGHALDLKTFKLVDQLSGRTLGVRADATPQVARIDAHLLNREGVTRLCYCGPVLHTRPASPHATREPLQLGAEIYGHAGLEAELESTELALAGLQASGITGLVMDLADVRLVQGVLAALGLDGLPEDTQQALVSALTTKDVGGLRDLAASHALKASPRAAEVLVALTTL
ncbi:MAG TPA: ATP phosphoribosyltransferase regulatory subunit, partial [Aquabacterium sp.]|nr:ATP phosphoribosyltransferase regulatory subunit [Aquabacterium sp.]